MPRDSRSTGWANPGLRLPGGGPLLPWFNQPRRRRGGPTLVNRLSAPFVAGKFRSRTHLSQKRPGFWLQVYPTSDDIFAAVSGVEAGYFLRRRTLASLMAEPSTPRFTEGVLQADTVARPFGATSKPVHP